MGEAISEPISKAKVFGYIQKSNQNRILKNQLKYLNATKIFVKNADIDLTFACPFLHVTSVGSFKRLFSML